MDNVEFEDNSVKVIAALNDSTIQWLYEAVAEITSAAKNGSRFDSGDLRKSWKYHVDEGAGIGTIGSELENAIWEEYGTGIWAEGGKGRKDYWVFVKGTDGTSTKSTKSYTQKQAKRAMAYLRSKGLEAYYTNGKKPHHTLKNAYTLKKTLIIKRLEDILKGTFK